MIESSPVRLRNFFDTTPTGLFATNIARIYGKNLQPVTPLNPVDNSIKKIINQSCPESEQVELTKYIESSLAPKNNRRAEFIHGLNHILTEVSSFLALNGIFRLLNQNYPIQNTISAAIIGANSSIFTSKHTEKPVRKFLDIFERKKQQRQIKAFLSCELKTK